MKPKKHIVVFSHGFGVRKDDVGLLSNIAGSIPEVESVLFDYFDIDEVNKVLTVTTFSKQVEMLNSKVTKIREANPDSVIDVIGHSQGSVIAVLAKPKGVRKVVLLAAPFDLGLERTLARYVNREDCNINLEGDSRLYQFDGYFRIIPKEYWVERTSVDPIKECNDYGDKTEITVIQAGQDNILAPVDLSNLNPKVKVTTLDGDHNFNNDAREGLVKTIREIIL